MVSTKENSLITVKNLYLYIFISIFTIGDPSNITKYKRKFRKLIASNLETVEINVKNHFYTKAKIDHSHLKLFHVFSK